MNRGRTRLGLVLNFLFFPCTLIEFHVSFNQILTKNFWGTLDFQLEIFLKELGCMCKIRAVNGSDSDRIRADPIRGFTPSSGQPPPPASLEAPSLEMVSSLIHSSPTLIYLGTRNTISSYHPYVLLTATTTMTFSANLAISPTTGFYPTSSKFINGPPDLPPKPPNLKPKPPDLRPSPSDLTFCSLLSSSGRQRLSSHFVLLDKTLKLRSFTPVMVAQLFFAFDKIKFWDVGSRSLSSEIVVAALVSPVRAQVEEMDVSVNQILTKNFWGKHNLCWIYFYVLFSFFLDASSRVSLQILYRVNTTFGPSYH
ncbi:hypothetical protein ACJIZ3_011106 [Penstemon smallii]|uniref:Uncharacterized protein n=1 Tax=Penstemon smallii TaxID=265156 RepID=A0ABD3UI69_9LAMI